MPEFHLETSGVVLVPWILGHDRPAGSQMGTATRWRDLDCFTQGYVEALFFTSGDEPGGLGGFADLAPDALVKILRDCANFQSAVTRACGYIFGYAGCPDAEQAGRDFWYTRNGHGCGFWDGDWPEPYGEHLTASAKAFGQVDSYLGDDGKVYL